MNEFRDCIVTNINELGCAADVEFDIEEEEGAKPVICKPFRHSAKERLIVRNIILEWRNANIVRDSESITLDLANGYLQIPMKESAFHKTAIIIEDDMV